MATSFPWHEKLRAFRAARGLTQVALAEMLGVDQATVSRWERGTVAPDFSAQRRLRDLILGEQAGVARQLVRLIRGARSPMAAWDENFVRLAASPPIIQALALPLNQIEGVDVRPHFTEDHEAVYAAADKHGGFFSGEFAVAESFVRLKTHSNEIRFSSSRFVPMFDTDLGGFVVVESLFVTEDAYQNGRRHGVVFRGLSDAPAG